MIVQRPDPDVSGASGNGPLRFDRRCETASLIVAGRAWKCQPVVTVTPSPDGPQRPGLARNPDMPRYFFDRDDESEYFQDLEGLELPDLAAARHEAVCGLLDAARDEVVGGSGRLGARLGVDDAGRDARTLSLRVRDADGALFFVVSLAIRTDVPPGPADRG